jgi:hypothetical protein
MVVYHMMSGYAAIKKQRDYGNYTCESRWMTWK